MFKCTRSQEFVAVSVSYLVKTPIYILANVTNGIEVYSVALWRAAAQTEVKQWARFP